MGFVADKLKSLASNYAMGKVGSLMSGLTQSTSGAQGKVAAQLLKKSLLVDSVKSLLANT